MFAPQGRRTGKGKKVMAGTRTAPDISVAAANSVTNTLHLIDASGDLFTDAIVTATSPTLVEVEAWAAAYQAATQASLYAVTVSSKWAGDADPDNAEALYRGSVKDGINMQFKNLTTLDSISPRLVAPIAAVMQGNQDIPLLSAAQATALITALLAILDGYNLESAQFTERRERSNNPRIKA